jgi:hypothetical protein
MDNWNRTRSLTLIHCPDYREKAAREATAARVRLIARWETSRLERHSRNSLHAEQDPSAMEPLRSMDWARRSLAETYGVEINVVRSRFFQAPDGREFLVRTFTVAPEVVEQTVATARS